MDFAFRLSGVTTLVRSPYTGGRAGLPVTYGSHEVDATDPALVVDLEHAPDLARRPTAPDHPAFRRRLEGGALVVERGDAEGRIDLDARPLRARFRVSGDPYAVEACVRVGLSVTLPRHEALLLHASAVRWAGEAHVFTGVSGAGKSTIAALLAEDPRCERLADEMVVLARRAGRWVLEVPPFLGIAGLPLGATAPLASIDLLAQAAEHRRVRLGRGDALRELLRHVVVYAAEPATSGCVLDLTSALVDDVPCHRLAFAPDTGVGRVLDVT